jgi:hypothetical protein
MKFANVYKLLGLQFHGKFHSHVLGQAKGSIPAPKVLTWDVCDSSFFAFLEM